MSYNVAFFISNFFQKVKRLPDFPGYFVNHENLLKGMEYYII